MVGLAVEYAKVSHQASVGLLCEACAHRAEDEASARPQRYAELVSLVSLCAHGKFRFSISRDPFARWHTLARWDLSAVKWTTPKGGAIPLTSYLSDARTSTPVQLATSERRHATCDARLDSTSPRPNLNISSPTRPRNLFSHAIVWIAPPPHCAAVRCELRYHNGASGFSTSGSLPADARRCIWSMVRVESRDTEFGAAG